MLKWINKKRNQKGFTLIELVVVIAILGILAALALPRFIGSQDTARKRADEANVASLRGAANVALAEYGKPSAEVTWTFTKPEGTDDGAEDKIVTTPASETNLIGKNYMDKWPVNPYDSARIYKVTIGTDGDIKIDGNGKN